MDAGHSYNEVVADITKAVELFPNAKIGGDDWLWGGGRPVQKATVFCAKLFNKEIKVNNNNWLYI